MRWNWLGAGVRTRDGNVAHRMGRAIKAGRETHKLMLDQYQQTKNRLVSYGPKKQGFLHLLKEQGAGNRPFFSAPWRM